LAVKFYKPVVHGCKPALYGISFLTFLANLFSATALLEHPANNYFGIGLQVVGSGGSFAVPLVQLS
jgi:hypothetical protein